ncbi:ABC transporter ATP-binding protein, partial [Salmonella enterica subsp. enterica serovar Typhi]
CFNKSKGVLITGLKLKAFRNPQPSWGFSIDKKRVAEATRFMPY